MEDSLINAEQVSSLEILRANILMLADTLLLKMATNPAFISELGIKGGSNSLFITLNEDVTLAVYNVHSPLPYLSVGTNLGYVSLPSFVKIFGEIALIGVTLKVNSLVEAVLEHEDPELSSLIERVGNSFQEQMNEYSEFRKGW